MEDVPSQIDKYLMSKRILLPPRPTPQEAYTLTHQTPPISSSELGVSGSGVYLVDIRPKRFRDEEGGIDGAMILERNVLEWRLDATSPWCIPQAMQPGFKPIIFCNEGYASSLAAAVLQELGVKEATDMNGGFRAWKAEGLPVETK